MLQLSRAAEELEKNSTDPKKEPEKSADSAELRDNLPKDNQQNTTAL